MRSARGTADGFAALPHDAAEKTAAAKVLQNARWNACGDFSRFD